jgi:translation elongation factor EF-1alpha
MSILKKLIKSVKKIFKSVYVKKNKSKKKRKISGRLLKKQSSTVKRKPRASVKRKPKQVKSSSKVNPARSTTKLSSLSNSKSISSRKKVHSAVIPIGEITHYFHKIKVCVVRINQGVLKKGDRLSIEGKHGSLIQVIRSMQIENEDVSLAKKGQLIGLKVSKPVYAGDLVKRL